MKILVILLILTTITSSFCFAASNQRKNLSNALTVKTEQYVSLECKAGDITLTLYPNNSFDLTILLWDNKSQRHVDNKSIKGSWSKDKKKLILIISGNNKIYYELKKTNLKIGNKEINISTYGFKSSDIIFFGSNIDLLKKDQIDDFLKGAALK